MPFQSMAWEHDFDLCVLQKDWDKIEEVRACVGGERRWQKLWLNLCSTTFLYTHTHTHTHPHTHTQIWAEELHGYIHPPGSTQLYDPNFRAVISRSYMVCVRERERRKWGHRRKITKRQERERADMVYDECVCE